MVWFGFALLLVLFPPPNGSFLPVRSHAELAAAGPGAGLGGAGRGGGFQPPARGSVPGTGSAPPSPKSSWIKAVRTPFRGRHLSGAGSELGLLTV